MPEYTKQDIKLLAVAMFSEFKKRGIKDVDEFVSNNFHNYSKK